jgi:hypothetical protein
LKDKIEKRRIKKRKKKRGIKNIEKEMKKKEKKLCFFTVHMNSEEGGCTLKFLE